jgi:hypothetical protein
VVHVIARRVSSSYFLLCTFNFHYGRCYFNPLFIPFGCVYYIVFHDRKVCWVFIPYSFVIIHSIPLFCCFVFYRQIYVADLLGRWVFLSRIWEVETWATPIWYFLFLVNYQNNNNNNSDDVNIVFKSEIFLISPLSTSLQQVMCQ